MSTNQNIDLNEALEIMQICCKEVGSYQLSKFRKNIAIRKKSSVTDIVTEVDVESERIIIRTIQKHFPGTQILAEESGSLPSNSRYEWVIDPLDGTTNFAQGLPIFSVSIGLKENGVGVLGLVYVPVLDELYSAVKGQGAFCNGQPIKVSEKELLIETVLGTGFPYDKDTNPENNANYFVNMLPKVRAIRRYGSAAYDLCLVAAGYLDGYWELNLSPWDVAAGELIVREAGGSIDYFRDDRKISIIAGPSFLLKAIKHEMLIPPE